jgi:hypothetical protein
VWGYRTNGGGIAVDTKAVATKVVSATTVNAAGAPDQPPSTGVALPPATTPAGPSTGTALPGGESTTPGAPAPCDAPDVDCAYPVEPVPTTVHLNKASLDTTMVYAQDGTIWLVPAFAFTGVDGGVYSVLAVQDGYIDLPAPAPGPEPLPAETVPAETVPAGSTPIATDPVLVTVVPVGPPVSAPDAPVAIDLATKVLQGLSESDAAAAAQTNGWELRVIERDGQPQVVTDDYRPNRIDVVVENGVVVAVKSIG